MTWWSHESWTFVRGTYNSSDVMRSQKNLNYTEDIMMKLEISSGKHLVQLGYLGGLTSSWERQDKVWEVLKKITCVGKQFAACGWQTKGFIELRTSGQSLRGIQEKTPVLAYNLDHSQERSIKHHKKIHWYIWIELDIVLSWTLYAGHLGNLGNERLIYPLILPG